MATIMPRHLIAALVAAALLAGCGGREAALEQRQAASDRALGGLSSSERASALALQSAERSSIFDLFGGGDDPNVTIEVNKYIWNATLDVLDFMPIEAADPFTGVLVFGYGTPPGGGTPYRATVYIRDPALDARSLNLALAERSGPVTPGTARAVENAILTRARQLRVADARL